MDVRSIVLPFPRSARLCLGLLAAAVALCLQAFAGPACSVCGKAIQGGYLEANGKAFCSQECFRKTLPVCAGCGKAIEGPHLMHEGKHYCSETCFERILPTCAICKAPLRQSFTIKDRTYCKAHAEGPRCDACALPVGEGKAMPDGRVACLACWPSLIADLDTAEPLYSKARDTLVVVLRQALPALPPLELVGTGQLPAHRGLEPSVRVRELGRYLRRADTATQRNLLGMTLHEETTVHRTILMLYGLTPGRFVATAAHELTHDLLAERYGGLDAGAPAWVEEGLCQYAAVLVCERLGYGDCVREIESSDDPVYGAGYRAIRGLFGRDGWPQVSRWLDAKGYVGLPAQAPEAEAPSGLQPDP